jgi:hypothetical protein
MNKQAERSLSRAERKAIFLALVQAQDAGLAIAQSRYDVAQRFGVSVRQLKRIEEEGVAGDWPPLA